MQKKEYILIKIEDVKKINRLLYKFNHKTIDEEGVYIHIKHLLRAYYQSNCMEEDNKFITKYLNSVDKNIITDVADGEIRKTNNRVYSIFLHYTIVFGG